MCLTSLFDLFDKLGLSVFQTLKQLGYQLDFIISTWEEHPVHEGILQLKNIQIEYESLTQSKDKMTTLAKQFEFYSDEVKPVNTLCMWYKWQRLALLLDTKKNSEWVLKIRPDILLPPDSISSLVKTISNFDEKNLAIPAGGDHKEGMNDMIAFGIQDKVKAYLNIFSYIPNYYQKSLFFHPEWMLRHSHPIAHRKNGQ